MDDDNLYSLKKQNDGTEERRILNYGIVWIRKASLLECSQAKVLIGNRERKVHDTEGSCTCYDDELILSGTSTSLIAT